MDLDKIKEFITVQGASFGLKILGAIAIWIIGSWLIGFAGKWISRVLNRQMKDPSLSRYLSSTVTVLLKFALIIAILGFFGVQTTTFAALLAAVGIAIGAAWGGLLANFAAGVFLVILRPFKIGDVITAAGVLGVVEEIGLFTSVINTPDSIKTIVPNGKIFSDNIQNLSASDRRRVDLNAQLHHTVDPIAAAELLKKRLTQIPNVLSSPAPEVEILEFSAMGPVLAVRPWCAPENYWQVYFDTNRAIREVFSTAGYPAPENRTLVRSAS
jgi:small conductance mechanosensitive channel